MIHAEMLIDGHFVGGPCDQAVGKQVIKQPGSDKIVGTAAEGGWSEANAALAAATDSFQTWRHSTARERQDLLRGVAALIRDRAKELAWLLCREIGKPIAWARAEVGRTGLTFELAAGELDRPRSESVPLEYDPRGVDYRCTVERFPLGPVLAIVPYNWPYNLAAHKLAPALAVGNTIVVKPSQQSPISTLTLARLIHEAGCPPGVVNAVNVPNPVAEKMALDPRVKMVSFTGSPAVGWKLKGLLPEKRVSLELGGNAYALVCADVDLGWAARRIIAGGYGYAGQVCIAVQHVLAHESIYGELRERLIEGTRKCPTGDVEDESTVCGPLISVQAAERVEEWVRDAVEKGATVLAGGQREGALMWPTLVETPPLRDAVCAGRGPGGGEGSRLLCQEVFGPVVTLASYKTEDEAFRQVNSGEYGINTGIFTNDAAIGEKAFRELEVGAVIVNDYPTLRFDAMPYGGVKKSGFGREGVRYAMEEMSELKALVTRLPG